MFTLRRPAEWPEASFCFALISLQVLHFPVITCIGSVLTSEPVLPASGCSSTGCCTGAETLISYRTPYSEGSAVNKLTQASIQRSEVKAPKQKIRGECHAP